MPLRDHFHAPLDNILSWEEFHGQWPATIVQHLNKNLPPRFVAGPRVHHGAQVEIDVSAYEMDELTFPTSDRGNGSVYAPVQPNVAVETDLLSTDEYEVRVYDTKRNRRLVAAIEIVSPANKDRTEHRSAFIGKCEAMLRKGVSVTIVDLVTSRHSNLYTELLELIDQRDPTMGEEPPAIYAVACRWTERGLGRFLEAWSHPLELGRPLPTLPLWLADDFAVPLELEESYEDTCRTLRIP